MYQPLIDNIPSDTSTILNFMHQAKRITQKNWTENHSLHNISGSLQNSIRCDIVRYFKIESYGAKARRYALANGLRGLHWSPDGK